MSANATAEPAQAVNTAPAVSDAVDTPLRRLAAEVAGVGAPFSLILYLALRGGGYDEIIRSEVGIVIWFFVALGALVGSLHFRQSGRAGLAGIAVLAALTGWTAASLLWTESMENAFAETARLMTYAGIFVVALGLQGRNGLRRTVIGIGAAVAVVAGLAVLSRFHPGWFPPNEFAAVFPDQQSRLNYPLNYPNGLAAFFAIGLPLLITVAVQARRLATRALATAGLPIVGLGLFLTYSRTGLLVAALGVMALIATHPRRLALLSPLGVGSLGTGLLVVAVTQRDDLKDGLLTDVTASQGNEMLVATVLVCAGVALLQAAVELAQRHGFGPRLRMPSPTRRQRLVALIAAVLMATAAGAAAGGPSALSQRWEQFKAPGAAAGSTERFAAATGNGRYQYWEAAVDAFRSEPLTGIGAGSYEYWWSRNGSLPGAIRDGHSLYFEMLGELGVVGLLLVLALVLLVVVSGIKRLRQTTGSGTGYTASALSAAVVFSVAAGGDWLWELAVLPATFLLLAAALLSRPQVAPPLPDAHPRRARVALRVGPAAAALPVLAILTIALLGARELRSSESALAASDPERALEAARNAQDFQPFASTPFMQEALALQQLGDAGAAIAPARNATDNEPTNWRTWHVVWQVETTRAEGSPAATKAYEMAYSLNPRSGSLASAAPDSDD